MLLALLWIILGITLLGLVFALNTLVSLLRDKVPYVPAPDWAIRWLSTNLRLPVGAVVVDIGCGDARVLRAILTTNPGTRAIGYERNWWPYFLAKARSRKTTMEVRRADFYRADLKDARVVFCFLVHGVMARVEKLLQEQLRPGVTVYSYGFRFPTWKPRDVIINSERPQGSRLYVYRV